MAECLRLLEGVEVVGQAGQAAQALEAVRTLRPDFVTLDVRMPDGSGIELLTAIKRENLARAVGMLTDLVAAPYRAKCLGAGADFFIDKADGLGEVRRIAERFQRQFNEGDCGRGGGAAPE